MIFLPDFSFFQGSVCITNESRSDFTSDDTVSFGYFSLGTRVPRRRGRKLGYLAGSGTKHVCGFDRLAFGLGLSTACFYSSS